MSGVACVLNKSNCNNLTNLKKMDKGIVPKNLYTYIDKITEGINVTGNIKKINLYLEKHPEIIKKILQFNQKLKLAYCTYAQKKYRGSIRINWVTQNTQYKILSFTNQICMYQYMIRYGGYMHNLSNIVLTKLQKAKLAIQYMSTNKKYCSNYITNENFSNNRYFLNWIKIHIYNLGYTDN